MEEKTDFEKGVNKCTQEFLQDIQKYKKYGLKIFFYSVVFAEFMLQDAIEFQGEDFNGEKIREEAKYIWDQMKKADSGKKH